jgi:hypothetical protein
MKYFIVNKFKKFISKKIIISNCKEIIYTLANKFGERNLENFENLESSKNYIAKTILLYGGSFTEESFKVNNYETSNIIFEIKKKQMK